jgi:hypothetical protein
LDKTKIVKNWVRITGAEFVLGTKGRAFALGWKLLNDYLFF